MVYKFTEVKVKQVKAGKQQTVPRGTNKTHKEAAGGSC